LTVSVALTVACSGVAAAQAAAAASIKIGLACVVNPNPTVGTPTTVTGVGFGPGDTINLASNKGAASGTATADANGNFTVGIAAPTLGTINPAAAAFVLKATDQTNGSITASTTFDVANLAVSTNPAQGKPSRKVTWSFSGFTSGAEIYAHYLHGKKVIATAKFGKATGPCGLLKTRAVFYPGKAKFNSYQVQVDDSLRYLATSLPRLVATLKTHIPL
jgi:hypothetical protein